ncbi:MAG: amino terminal protease family protein [Holophagaceae bacterium]|nr:amino terminal protease family protein [Holophagaceae bacterium]
MLVDMAAQTSPQDLPWRPHPQWADPLILVLALLAMLMAWGSLKRRVSQPLQGDRITIQGRLLDFQLSAMGPRAPWDSLQKQAKSPWDRGLLAIHAAEQGQVSKAADWIKSAPAPLGAAWQRAYGSGTTLSARDRGLVRQGLIRSHAADLLEARLSEADGQDARAFRQQALMAIRTRLALLGVLGGLACVAVVGGLGFALFLAVRKTTPPAPLPSISMDGRALAILFLGWFLAMQVSGTMVQILLAFLPFLRPWALSWAYLLHVLVGTGMLCRMEGISLGELWHRMTPGPLGRNLAWGCGYLGLTVLMSLALSLILSPFMPNQEPPQRELVEILSRARSLGTAIPLFLTVAVLAPCFEELLFRGTLLPALRRRLGPWAALFLGALAFGAMHLQPAGLPLLSLLGLAMGLAFLRTGSLWTSILVHGCWNGAQFLLMQVLY